jgi:hypothetical protein|tara:strand:- start:21680 stop:22432 length:753 start_codon:yes stop_codon:yes gene_type:complete
MKNIILLTGIFILSCQDQPKKKTTGEYSVKTEFSESNSTNWVNIFDGKTFKGWHQFNKTEMSPAWTIDDGAMVFNPIEENKSTGHNIVTDAEYTNFELSIEWKISEGGNSGIFWGVKEDLKYNEAYITGPEIQVLDNERHPDAKNNPKYHQAGALYDLVQPSMDVCNPAGNWNLTVLKINHVLNTGSVNLNGNEIAIFPVNGREWEKLVSGSKFDNEYFKDFGKFKTGKIGLQDHGNMVSYRNIKIREIE